MVAGTPLYMSPESFEGIYSSATDLWSIGVLLYTLVSGYMPFYSTQYTEVYTKI